MHWLFSSMWQQYVCLGQEVEKSTISNRLLTCNSGYRMQLPLESGTHSTRINMVTSAQDFGCTSQLRHCDSNSAAFLPPAAYRGISSVLKGEGSLSQIKLHTSFSEAPQIISENLPYNY